MLKNFLLILSLMLIPLMARSEDNLGQAPQDLRWQQLLDRAEETIANSQQSRTQWTGRTVAGLSEKDKKWAAEYEALMEDESDKDWLNIAEKL